MAYGRGILLLSSKVRYVKIKGEKFFFKDLCQYNHFFLAGVLAFEGHFHFHIFVPFCVLC